MQLYSELYNCYYNIIHKLLCLDAPFSKEQLVSTIADNGFGETMLYLIPKISSGEWGFFIKENDIYISTIGNKPDPVLTLLQKRWLKALLRDNRIRLFLDEEDIKTLDEVLMDIEPLYSKADFYIYDQFNDGDDYENDEYIKNFRTILSAIKDGRFLNIEFQSHRDKRIHYQYLPCRLEYSIKNDRFRLLALEARGRSNYIYHTINLSRIKNITKTNRYADSIPDINEYITKDYYHEPVTLLITNERNALERAMLQFANYKKNTTRQDDDTYKCEIYYNKSNETELLIEVLSFGPAIKVIGNEHFLRLLKARLNKQKELITKESYNI